MNRSSMRRLQRFALACATLLAGNAALAASPTCVGSEQLLSWPAGNPIWEMCYLRPSLSSGPRGSGLELRNVYLHGRMVLKRAHAPMLFAEYTTSTCYRDWKNTDSQQITWAATHPGYGRRTTTSCDRSKDATSSYGTCPFQLSLAGGGGNPTGSCATGVAIDDHGSYVEITTQYNAAWYQYSSRFRFHANGAFEPEFGFGNSNGTNNGITHWHHNYWRLDFDIEGAANDVIRENDVDQPSEFATLRCSPRTSPACAEERFWQVADTQTGRGFQMLPSSDDYTTPTNQSGRGLHVRDVIGTVYNSNELSDLATENTGDCVANHNALANGQDLNGASGEGADVVLYYRAGVRDLTSGSPLGPQDSMVCKSVGPIFTPIGSWLPTLFDNGFD